MLILDRLRRWRQARPHTIGSGVEIETSARFNYPARIALGNYVYIGPECLLDGKGTLTIGAGTILGPRVVVWTYSHRFDQEEMLPYDPVDEHRQVTIGRGVWIGLGAIVMPGTTIEDGAVVAMGSVVRGRVEAGELVGGNPAQVIGRRASGVVERLVAEEAFFLKRHGSRKARRALREHAAEREVSS